MSLQPVITPAGHLIVQESLADDSSRTGLKSKAVEQLRDAFGESAPAGLVLLASGKPQTELPADFLFWREFAQQFFHGLCNLSEENLKKALLQRIAKQESLNRPRNWI